MLNIAKNKSESKSQRGERTYLHEHSICWWQHPTKAEKCVGATLVVAPDVVIEPRAKNETGLKYNTDMQGAATRVAPTKKFVGSTLRMLPVTKQITA